MSKKTGKQAVQDAIALAKAGKHRKALKILEPYKEHTKVKQLYDKILLDAPEPSTWQKLDDKQRGCVIFIILFVVCGVVFWLFSIQPQDKAFLVSSFVCTRVITDYNQPCDSQSIRENYPDELEACIPSGEVRAVDEFIDNWIICLELEGVDILDEIDP